MKILVVDDSQTIRAMLRRALAGIGQTDVSEAQNGVEALAEIGRCRYGLVILDVNMPVMDGIDTLEAIRASPPYAGLPVVVLTSEKSEHMVRRLVEMGIADYLSKPLSQDRLTDRLGQIVSRLSLSTPSTPTLRSAEHGQRVLVIEQDLDRCPFVVEVLSRHFHVVGIDSGAGALQMMMEPGAPDFDIVMLGLQTGLPPAELFIPKMKAVRQLSGARIVVCRRKGESPGKLVPPLIDDAMEWSFVPEAFLASFERALTGVDTPLAGLPSFRASLERDAVSATEQLFGLMLSSEVTLVRPGAEPLCPWPGQGVHARLDLVAPGTLSLAVLFRAGDQSAAAITAILTGTSTGEIDQSDARATVGEFANIIVGRLRNRMLEVGIHTQMQLPDTWTGLTGDSFPFAEAATLTFNLSRPPVSVELLLSVGCHAANGPAAPGAA